jgi:hypothetical protein
MRVATADDLRANLIGAWTLQSYVSVSIDGWDVVYPLGVDARIIMIAPRVTWTLRTTDESGIPYDFAGGYRALAPL